MAHDGPVCPSSELVEFSGERQVGPNETLKPRERVETNISFRTDIPCCGNGSMIVKVVIRGDEFPDETLELMVVSEDEAVAIEFLDLRAIRIGDPGGGLFEYVGRRGEPWIFLMDFLKFLVSSVQLSVLVLGWFREVLGGLRVLDTEDEAMCKGKPSTFLEQSSAKSYDTAEPFVPEYEEVSEDEDLLNTDEVQWKLPHFE
eukprot:s2931_g8.t1